jgi:hypothetical protein
MTFSMMTLAQRQSTKYTYLRHSAQKTFSIMTLSISINVILLRVTYSYCYAECHYAECRYAECRYAECRSTLNCSLSVKERKIRIIEQIGACHLSDLGGCKYGATTFIIMKLIIMTFSITVNKLPHSA